MPDIIQHHSIHRALQGPETHPDLAAGEVHFWYSSIDFGDEFFTECLSSLTPDEQARADRYRFEKDRHQFVMSRGILRRLLGGYLNKSAAEIEFEFAEFGKPFLRLSSPPFFNVAHSGKHLAIGFSLDREIGVDVEEGGGRRHRMIDLVDRICTPVEHKFVQNLDENEAEAALMRLWTAKEAYLKALGTGFQIEPNQIEIEESVLRGETSPSRVRRIDVDDSTANDHNILYPLPDSEKHFGCSAAIALAGDFRSDRV